MWTSFQLSSIHFLGSFSCLLNILSTYSSLSCNQFRNRWLEKFNYGCRYELRWVSSSKERLIKWHMFSEYFSFHLRPKLSEKKDILSIHICMTILCTLPFCLMWCNDFRLYVHILPYGGLGKDKEDFKLEFDDDKDKILRVWLIIDFIDDDLHEYWTSSK